MAYTRTTWVDYPTLTTPMNATRLNNMEQGIVDAYVRGPGGRWSRVANQSATSGVQMTVSFDTEAADTNGFLTPTSGLFTVTSGTGGMWVVFATGAFSASVGTGRAYLEILTGSSQRARQPFGTGEDVTSVMGFFNMADADNLVVNVLQTSGGSLNFTGTLYATLLGT